LGSQPRPAWRRRLVPEVTIAFSAHPHGGAVLGNTTDTCGRVAGYIGSAIVDSAKILDAAGALIAFITVISPR